MHGYAIPQQWQTQFSLLSFKKKILLDLFIEEAYLAYLQR